MQDIINKLIRKFARYHKIILSVFLIATFGLVFFARKIKVNSDLMVLLPEKNKSVVNLKKIIKSFGGEGYYIIVLKYNHVFKRAGLNLILIERELDRLVRYIRRWDSFPFHAKPIKAIFTKINSIQSKNNNLKKSIFVLDKSSNLTLNQQEFLKKIKELYLLNVEFLKNEKFKLKSFVTGKEFKKLKKIDEYGPVVKYIKKFKKHISEHKKLINKNLKIIKNNFAKPELLKQTADKIANKLEVLKKQNIIKFVDYTFPIKWVKKRMFLLMDIEDLREVYYRIRSVRKRAVSFLRDSDEQLSFKDIAEKYDVNNFVSEDDNDTENNPEPAEDVSYNLSRTGDYLLLLVKPSGRSSSLAFSKILHDKISGVIDSLKIKKIDPNISYGYTGRYVMKVEDAETINRDIRSTALLTFGLMGLIILILFRKITPVILVYLSLVCGIIWAIAFLYITIGYLNIITAFLIAILSGLGIDFNIHFLHRYYEERKKGASVVEALKIVYSKTLPAILASCITTTAAFLCLVISPFKGFSHFGFTIAFGLIFVLISIVLMFPTLMLIIEKIKPYKEPKSKKGRLMQIGLGWKGKFPYPIFFLISGIVITLFSIFSQVKFDFNMNAMRNVNSRSAILDKESKKYFKIAFWPAVGYTNSMENIAKLYEKFKKKKKISKDFLINNHVFDVLKFLKKLGNKPEQIQKKVKQLVITFNKFRSIQNFFPQDQAAKFEIIKKIEFELTNEKWISRIKDKKLLKRIDKIKKYLDVKKINSLNQIPDLLLKKFINPDEPNKIFFFVYPKADVELTSITTISRYANDLLNFIDIHNTQRNNENIVVASETIIFTEIVKIIKRDSLPIIFLTILSIFLILYFDLRKVSAVLYVLIPLIIGITWILGFMRLFSVPFTYFNIAIVPTLIGMGIDDGIHLYHRFKEEGYKNLKNVIGTTGMAMFFTSFTTMIGFGMLVFAEFSGLKSIGWLAIIGIGSAFVVTVTFLPAILQLLFDKKRKKSK